MFEAPEKKGIPTQPCGNNTEWPGDTYLSVLLESQGLVTCQLVEASRPSPLPFQAGHSLADSTYKRRAWGKEQVHLPLTPWKASSLFLKSCRMSPPGGALPRSRDSQRGTDKL